LPLGVRFSLSRFWGGAVLPVSDIPKNGVIHRKLLDALSTSDHCCTNNLRMRPYDPVTKLCTVKTEHPFFSIPAWKLKRGSTYFGYFSRKTRVQPHHLKRLSESFPLMRLNIGLS